GRAADPRARARSGRGHRRRHPGPRCGPRGHPERRDPPQPGGLRALARARLARRARGRVLTLALNRGGRVASVGPSIPSTLASGERAPGPPPTPVPRAMKTAVLLSPFLALLAACEAIQPLLPTPPEELDLWSDAAAGVTHPKLAVLCADVWQA